jgi:hypothetical protein
MPAVDATQYVADESARLTSKLASVNDAYNAQMRNATLNDSYRKRYAKYIEIVTILILATVAYLGISYLQSTFPNLPPIVFDALSIIIVSLVMLYLLFAAFELFTRSNMNYDEIALPPQDISGITVNTASVGNTIAGPARTSDNGLIDTCSEASCCSTGTYWDTAAKKCVSSRTTAFSTLSEAYEYKQIAAPMSGQLPVVDYNSIGSSSSAEAVVAGTSISFSNV